MWFRKSTPLFSTSEIQSIQQKVKLSEANTSGEIRIYIEMNCRWMEPVRRAAEIFHELRMFQTVNRNAVLIYLAYADHDFALYADKGIYTHAAPGFWELEAKKLARSFHQKAYMDGLSGTIDAVGKLLTQHYPLHGENKNELPDEIIFGK